MPHSFRFPSDYEIWVPMALDPIKETQGDMIRLVEVVGRLRPNATPEHAQAELNVISHHVSEPNKDKWPTSGAQIVPLHQFLVAGVRRTVARRQYGARRRAARHDAVRGQPRACSVAAVGQG